MAAIPPAVLLILSLCFLLKGSPQDLPADRNKETGAFRNGVRFLMRPKIFALLFCGYAVFEISMGYKTYLFPLFAADSGFDKAFISMLCVCANAFCFFCTPVFTKISQNLGSRKPLLIYSFISAFAFCMFLLNSSFLWAVAALFIIGLSSRASAPCMIQEWVQEAREIDFPSETAEVSIRSVDAMFSMAKGPVSGSLLTLGKSLACGCIAAFISVVTLIYARVSKRKPGRT